MVDEQSAIKMAIWTLRQGRHNWSPDAELGFALWKRTRGAYTTGLGYDDANAPGLILAAWEGDEAAEAAVRMMALDLVERDEPLPPNLKKFVLDLLGGRKPARRGGRPVQHTMARDLDIAIAVSNMVFLGFRPTRNRSTVSPSACSIVADALAAIGSALGERRVEAIWAAGELKDEPPLEPPQLRGDPRLFGD